MQIEMTLDEASGPRSSRRQPAVFETTGRSSAANQLSTTPLRGFRGETSSPNFSQFLISNQFTEDSHFTFFRSLSLSASPTSILYSNYCHSLIEQLLLTLFITDPGRSFVSRRAPVASPFFNKLHIEIPSKADTERPRKTTSYQSECTPLLFHSCFYRLLWHTVIAMAQVTTTTSTTTLCPAAL